MSAKAQKVQQPDDPDPTPIVSSDSNAETQQAKRQTKKRLAGQYGRQQTILAGNNPNNSQTAQQKKTILGG